MDMHTAHNIAYHEYKMRQRDYERAAAQTQIVRQMKGDYRPLLAAISRKLVQLGNYLQARQQKRHDRKLSPQS